MHLSFWLFTGPQVGNTTTYLSEPVRPRQLLAAFDMSRPIGEIAGRWGYTDQLSFYVENKQQEFRMSLSNSPTRHSYFVKWYSPASIELKFLGIVALSVNSRLEHKLQQLCDEPIHAVYLETDGEPVQLDLSKDLFENHLHSCDILICQAKPLPDMAIPTVQDYYTYSSLSNAEVPWPSSSDQNQQFETVLTE